MTKILKIVFLLILFHSDVFSCSCRYETSGYELYYDIKHCFEGTVIKIAKRRFDETITFRINKVYKGRFDTIVQITTSSSASDCGVYLELNKTYLIEAKLFQKKYSTSSCLRNSIKGTERFTEDTMMLNLFSKKNVFVNLPNIRGQIKHGKRVGFWVCEGDSGEFKNGRKHGIWKEDESDHHYKNGRLVKYFEYVLNEKRTDSTKVIHRGNTAIMYYHNGQIHKIWKARKIVVYYPNGNVKEKMKLNKHGYIYDYWFKYDEAGNIVEKKYYENDNAEDGSYYFYYP